MPTADYYDEIESLEKNLKGKDVKSSQLTTMQSRLDELMYRFKNDDGIGTDRYSLSQVQALISFRRREYDKSKRFIDHAILLRGGGYKLADQLRKRLAAVEFKRKSEKVWWTLILGPLGGLITVALLQFCVNFIFDKSGVSESGLEDLVNVLSVIIGTACVLLLLFLPIWIIELVSVKRFNERHGIGAGLKKRNGILIAIFLGGWYWAYTYKIDKKKFWINLVLSFCTAGYWGIVVWIWAIIVSIRRHNDFYLLYPYYDNK